MMRWTEEKKAEVRALWDEGLTKGQIAKRLGTTRAMICSITRRMTLQFHGGNGVVLQPSHSAARKGTTIFPSRIAKPDENIFKPGDYQRKIGGKVFKGRWRGMPVYCLTLEERATCPRSCSQWLSCYGNNMHMAKRFAHGPELEEWIWTGLELLQMKHPQGFVVRLHILGDFYSVAYVRLWYAALMKFPALRVFGYTAWQENTKIGGEIAHLRSIAWDRFSVRTSGALIGLRTNVIATIAERKKDQVVCPAQLSQTASCGTCGLCWNSKRPIAFLEHSRVNDLPSIEEKRAA